MSKPKLDLAGIRSSINKTQFNAWMGIKVLSASATETRLELPWRNEFEGASGKIHGGILASAIDAAGYATVLAAQGASGPTVDMRIDYHRPTGFRPLHLEGQVLKTGRTLCTVDVYVRDGELLVASGRCLFASSAG